MIHANCRAQFTADDFGYVVKVLARSPRDSVSLVSLLSDEETRDQVLDHDLLYKSLVDDVSCLKVSPAFYFYILTRRVLRRVGIEERALCDYIAAVLAAFSHMNQLMASTQTISRHFGYISDLLAKLDQASSEEVFLLRSHLGNYSLFLSGIFAERVQAHAERRGAPGLTFYEAIGQSSYQSAAQHPQAKHCQLQEVYEQLAVEFRAVRMALNHLAENLIHWRVPVI